MDDWTAATPPTDQCGLTLFATRAFASMLRASAVKVSPSSRTNDSRENSPDALKFSFHASVVRLAEIDASMSFSLSDSCPSIEPLALMPNTQKFHGSLVTSAAAFFEDGESNVTFSRGASEVSAA
jgi:hypothetical protein